MIKNVLCGITDVHVYPVVSLILFLLVFAGAALWAFTMKKSQAAALCRMPLEDSAPADDEIPVAGKIEGDKP